MFSALSKSRTAYFIIAIYIAIVAWWVKLNLSPIDKQEAYLFNWFYGLIALTGALYCIFSVSKTWGGYKSIVGKGLIFISLGLIGQWFGLQIWTYYNVVTKVEIPYPSLADIGYFALIPFYTIGALMFAHAVGGKFSLRTMSGRLTAIVVPIIMLLFSYFLFIQNLGFDLSNILKSFLDFGYPLGEVIPVSIAMFTLSLSRKFLGGRMKTRVLYLIFAFTFQFITEYLFLYAATEGTYYNGGINDLLYATSYTIMSLGLISFKTYN